MKIMYQASSKSQNPTTDNGMVVNYADSKRARFKIRWYFLLFLVTAPVALVLWILLRPHIFVLGSGIITTEPLEIRSPVQGDLTSVLTKTSHQLNAGDPLFIIKDPQLDSQIAELERQLSMLNTPDSEINQLILVQFQTRIDIANQGLWRQNSLLKSYTDFQKKGIVPNSDMAAVLQAHTASKMALAQAKVDLIRMRQQQAIEQIAGVIAQSRYGIKLELARLQARKSRLVMKSPYNARVAEILVQPGEFITQGQPMILIAGRDEPLILAYLDPKYFEYAVLDQKATVKLPNGDHFTARISEPTELVGKLPKQLSGPFDGERSMLKVTLLPEVRLPPMIEGVPVEISFDRHLALIQEARLIGLRIFQNILKTMNWT